MSSRVQYGGLSVAESLSQLIENSVLPGTEIKPADFWASFESILDDLGPVNKALLTKRDAIQEKIDTWHQDNPGAASDLATYKAFLTEIGYLCEEPEAFVIGTENVDPEIATIPGPQLVVPVSNARFALNACNARWGSLFDTAYGTDAVSEDGGAERRAALNPVRRKKVISWVQGFLDKALPLAEGQHEQVSAYGLEQSGGKAALTAILASGSQTRLANTAQLAGYTGDAARPDSLLLKNNNLHIELSLAEGMLDDVFMESAISTIMDCEDSVAAVDAADKVGVYENWLGLMRGDLQVSFSKGGKTVNRALNPDREYTVADGSAMSLPGRSMLLVRNVGHLMTTDAVLDKNGNEVPEGMLDAIVTGACALHDLNGSGPLKNSRHGSMYVVKPKMHGPEEVELSETLFSRVEDALGMARNTIKIGVMDEERRTTVNLKACIKAVKDRIVFINTGFLDRTGDEIHTSMQAGAFLPKDDIKEAAWLPAYENWNVDIGLACGFSGKAQIGKGMWAMPDEMGAMLEAKIGHPMSGANCAWVPSPTAATLHATHYHQVDVLARQAELTNREPANLDDILTLPLMAAGQKLDDSTIQDAIENNAQGLLGYVVRWVNQGVGCSKVPDINNVGLMEDRATLRISSQHLANWLHHGVVSDDQVMAAMKKMAAIVDEQNKGDGGYVPMTPDIDNSVAFKAACDLVFDGKAQPNGYTEPRLHARRREFKQAAGA